eukprot:TRINITY_DN11780_c1_g1_i1.p1 TRINITY_DN11780_c1_g1~~TRINITY_DN11780_c1_g1_i1.p1  ORF type:complete len:347 (+),score=64.19 TRINITY_DN11780_c1_g1_i1:90-1130(+)
MAATSAALPINTRRAMSTGASAVVSPTALGSLRITTSTPCSVPHQGTIQSIGSVRSSPGGAKPAMRWADATPTPIAGDQFSSGVFRPPTMRGGATEQTPFPSTPSPWPSMTKYNFGAIHSAQPAVSPALASNSSTSPQQLQQQVGSATSSPTPVVYAMPTGMPPHAGLQPQVVWMPMPMPCHQPQGMILQAAPTAPAAAQAAMAHQTSNGSANGIGAAELSPLDEQQREASAGRQLFGEALDPNRLDLVQAQAQVPVNQPWSMGSSLHGTGRCSPCAWFWKAKGCQNALNCAYCHLCPEGELKQRKKAKVAALRAGVLQPQAVTQANGTGAAPPAALKLTALLQGQ